MKRIEYALAASLIFIAGSCHTDTGTLEVRSLLASASQYNAKVVRVHGCYRNGLEKVVIGPCINPGPSELIWIVPYTQIENTEKSVPGYKGRSTDTILPSPREQELARDLAALPDGKISEVIVVGEFQYSGQPVFGHGSGYRYQLILYRVLSAKCK